MHKYDNLPQCNFTWGKLSCSNCRAVIVAVPIYCASEKRQESNNKKLPKNDFKP